MNNTQNRAVSQITIDNNYKSKWHNPGFHAILDEQ